MSCCASSTSGRKRALVEPAYLALLRETAEVPSESRTPNLCYILVAAPADQQAALARLTGLGLHHPRLLAPRSLVAHGEQEFLAIETVCDAATELPIAVVAGGRLSAEDTLRAGAGLADALAYLHRNGLAHLHVSPETTVVQEGRAYLAGVERATQIEASGSEPAALFARDANFLARTLEMLAGVPQVAPPDEHPAQAAVREIAARGVVGGFASPEEVGAASTAALEAILQVVPLTSEPEGTTRLALRAGSASTVGRVRSQNQDALAVAHFDVSDDVQGDMPLGVFLVADGMGGEARGELASRIAARTVSSEVSRSLLVPSLMLPATAAVNQDERFSAAPGGSRDLADALVRSVELANNQVRGLSERLGQATGTTLTALAVRGAHAVLAHVGDSRAYLLHGDSLMRLTEDHSLMARLEAMDHPLLHDPAFFMSRSILYRSLGQEDDAPPDVLDVPLSPGDRLLLCSDGLWDELDDQTIGLTLATAGDPDQCAQQLIEMANAHGGHDNSTAVVLFVEQRPADLPGSLEETEEDADDEAADETADDSMSRESSAAESEG
jgi:protein phosphatase